MKALAVRPGIAASTHIRAIDAPRVDQVPDGRGVLIRTLQVGLDATDTEIYEAKYGQPPEGDDYLVLGHEMFGVVEQIGSAVTHVQPGDLCTCTVRRPGASIFDRIGRNDITSEEVYFERGINLLHGFLAEQVVEDAEYVVKVPAGLKHIGVLAEPASVCAKAIEQAYLAQQRLQVWEPERAFVLGSGQIGLLTTMMLRLRGLDVYTIARTPNPGLREEIVNGYGGRYVSSREISIARLAEEVGRPDLIIEATGDSGVAFESMEILALNGALVWTSVTGGNRRIEVPADAINLQWVLGNKLLVGSVNGNRKHFEKGVADLALGEAMFPGVTERLLTHPVDGFDEPEELMRLLVKDRSALKVFVRL